MILWIINAITGFMERISRKILNNFMKLRYTPELQTLRNDYVDRDACEEDLRRLKNWGTRQD